MPRTPRRPSLRTALPPKARHRRAGAAARLAAPRRSVFLRAQLLQPHPPHRLAESRRPDRAGREHSLSLAIPRRPDRRTRAKPAVDRRNHRRRHRGTGDHRNQHHHHRPRPPARSQAGRNLRRARRRFSGLDFPINPERVAPVLRRLISPTKTRARIYDRDGVLILDSRNLYGRGDVHAVRTATALDRQARDRRAHDDRDSHLAQSRRSAALPRTRARRTARATARSPRARRQKEQHGAHQRARRGDRLGRRAGAALPRRPRRADAVDAGRRYRPDGDRRAARDPEGVRRRGRGDDRAVAAAGEHHRRPGAPACRQRRAASAAASGPASRFPISPAAATRSAISPARCAT